MTGAGDGRIGVDVSRLNSRPVLVGLVSTIGVGFVDELIGVAPTGAGVSIVAGVMNAVELHDERTITRINKPTGKERQTIER
jgi:hypothetical protein